MVLLNKPLCKDITISNSCFSTICLRNLIYSLLLSNKTSSGTKISALALEVSLKASKQCKTPVISADLVLYP